MTHSPAGSRIVVGVLPPEQLTAEVANEPPARVLLDRAAHAEVLVLGTTRLAPQPGQPPQAIAQA